MKQRKHAQRTAARNAHPQLAPVAAVEAPEGYVPSPLQPTWPRDVAAERLALRTTGRALADEGEHASLGELMMIAVSGSHGGPFYDAHTVAHSALLAVADMAMTIALAADRVPEEVLERLILDIEYRALVAAQVSWRLRESERDAQEQATERRSSG